MKRGVWKTAKEEQNAERGRRRRKSRMRSVEDGDGNAPYGTPRRTESSNERNTKKSDR